VADCNETCLLKDETHQHTTMAHHKPTLLGLRRDVREEEIAYEELKTDMSHSGRSHYPLKEDVQKAVLDALIEGTAEVSIRV
jgi:hypothetical protein